MSLALAFAALLVVIWILRPREPVESPESMKLRAVIADAERLHTELANARDRLRTLSGLARAQSEAELQPLERDAQMAETRVEQLRAVLAARGFDVRGFTTQKQ